MVLLIRICDKLHQNLMLYFRVTWLRCREKFVSSIASWCWKFEGDDYLMNKSPFVAITESGPPLLSFCLRLPVIFCLCVHHLCLCVYLLIFFLSIFVCLVHFCIGILFSVSVSINLSSFSLSLSVCYNLLFVSIFSDSVSFIFSLNIFI